MKFSWKNIENWQSWKMRFFESAILNSFFLKKNVFASSQLKSVNIYSITRIFRNFDEKILRIGGAGKWGFLSRPFWISKWPTQNFFLLLLNKNKQLLHMRYHLFLKYGWFSQNLGKEAVWTNMHTTVIQASFQMVFYETWKWS